MNLKTKKLIARSILILLSIILLIFLYSIGILLPMLIVMGIMTAGISLFGIVGWCIATLSDCEDEGYYNENN